MTSFRPDAKMAAGTALTLRSGRTTLLREAYETTTPVVGTAGLNRPAPPLRGSGAPPVNPAVEPESFIVPTSHELTYWVHEVERGGVKLLTPILSLHVSDDDGDGIWVASDRFSTVYGSGSGIDAAVADYVDNLFDQYDVLDRDEAILAPVLLKELDALRQRFTREA